jgi:hypothetical protein
MAQWRRPGANEILVGFSLLTVLAYLCAWLSHADGRQVPLLLFLVAAFLTWRVSRGGRISRTILIAGSALAYVASALAVARSWNVAVAALLLITAVQVTLLLSPPVYGRTRSAPVLVRAPGWSRLLPPRPPAWLLPWGLLAGLLVTLACLGSMDFATIAGCRPAASEACGTLAEGYPLRWLTATQGTPLISKGALLRDSVQWALGCTTLLYVAWLWLTPREAFSNG